MIPTKRIISRAHLQSFLESPTYADLVAFVTQLNESVKGVKLTDEVIESPAVKEVLAALDKVERIVADVPPVENGKSRFGNPAFRTFYDAVQSETTELHSSISGLEADHREELSGYFTECWGSKERIDYGSGMELHFICWLLCLRKLKVLSLEDSAAIVLRVFWKYMKITRLLQTTYWLEPAGSHGAQGLDDYHFAVFIFGSSQLRDHKYIRPKAIHDNDILEEFSKDYMYLSYIHYINSIKTESLRWHSPMLDDISGVKTWEKLNGGMQKMYYAEVLSKLPVAQHFLFGSLLPYPRPSTSLDSETGPGRVEEGISRDSHGHLHVRGEGFGDCCGIAIPSGFAAAREARLKAGESEGGIRRIPFD